jgi:hypothetical protein
MSIETLQEHASEALLKLLQKAGIKLNGHALLACDEAARTLAAQIKSLEQKGNLRKNETCTK